MDLEIKSKSEIYFELCMYYSKYNKNYIKSKIDGLYETGILNNELSEIGWVNFVNYYVISQINLSINKNLISSQNKLLLAKCLHNYKYCSHDLLEKISDSL